MSINTEMTALADAVRAKSGTEGKLTIAAMTAAVNGIVINSGSDIDLSGVTVTADKMLSGVIAVGKNGETITGNIATVTPAVDKNVFSVKKGYVDSDFSETIPEATVTETDSNVTITPGYLKDELSYALGSGAGESAVFGTLRYKEIDGVYTPFFQPFTIDETGSSVIGDLKEEEVPTAPLTSIKRLDMTSELMADGQQRIYTEHTVYVTPNTSDEILACKVGNKYYVLDSPLSVYSTVKPDMLLDTTVVAGYYDVSINDDDIVLASRIKNGKIPTVTATSDGEYVTVPVGYIAEEQSFPITVLDGGLGIFDLVKVTEYIPYSPEITEITSIEVSGFGYFGNPDNPEEDGYEDWRPANGKYLVTSETSGKSGSERIYKHETEDYQFKVFIDEYDEYGGDGWVFVNPDGFEIWNVPYELESGTSDFWHSPDWGENFTLTLTCTTTTIPEQPLVLKGNRATTYSGGEWTFSSSETSLTGFEQEPKKSFIYAAKNFKLIGKSIGYGGDSLIPTNGLIAYFPLKTDFDTAVGDYSPTVTTATFEERYGRKAMKATGGTYAEWQGATNQTQGALSIFFAVTGINYSSWNGFVSVGEDISTMFGLDNYSGKINGRIGYDWGQFGSLSTTAWETLALTRDASGNYKMYLNGEKIAETTQSTITTVNTQYIDAGWCRNEHTGNCYISDYCVYDRVLTADEIASMHELILSEG